MISLKLILYFSVNEGIYNARVGTPPEFDLIFVCYVNNTPLVSSCTINSSNNY